MIKSSQFCSTYVSLSTCLHFYALISFRPSCFPPGQLHGHLIGHVSCSFTFTNPSFLLLWEDFLTCVSNYSTSLLISSDRVTILLIIYLIKLNSLAWPFSSAPAYRATPAADHASYSQLRPPVYSKQTMLVPASVPLLVNLSFWSFFSKLFSATNFHSSFKEQGQLPSL